MDIGELITLYRKEAKMTIEELVEKSGVPKGTLNKMISGITKAPTLDNIKAIAKALGKRLDDFDDSSEDPIPYFTKSEKTIVNQYRTLDEHGKSVVEQIIALECERMSRMRDVDRPCAPARVIQLDKYLVPSSAGTGVVSIDCDKEVITVVDNMYTRQAAFAVPIRGNSMEPRFRDGDILLISEDLPELGEIGIFVMSDRLYLKQLGEGKLISLNPDYSPIPMDESIRCQGKVICVLDPGWIV